MIAFSLHGLYSNGICSKRITHPLRHSMNSAFAWFTLHIPLVSAVTLCGDSTAELIKDEEVPDGIRWIFSGAFAVAMLSLASLALLEKEHDEAGELWFSKRVRIAPRFVSAVIVALLPLASQETLNSDALLAITASLSMGTWIFQEVGAMDGPAAPWYRKTSITDTEKDAEQEDAVKQATTPIEEMQTWRGMPLFIEPGTWVLDKRCQRGSTATFADAQGTAAST
jgi:hypothetical protein